MRLTDRDSEIVSTLAARVRLFTLNQIARTWWASSKHSHDQARKRLKQLEDELLLRRLRLTVVELHELSSPIVTWAPGQDQPNLGSAAWKMQSRWHATPRPVSAYIATKAAAKQFGGAATGRLKHHYQATHDIGVAEMYLQLRKSRADLIQYWVGEDILAPHRRRQKLPDAVIASLPGATPQLVLEFGGAYDKARLLAFHQECSANALPYEIW